MLSQEDVERRVKQAEQMIRNIALQLSEAQSLVVSLAKDRVLVEGQLIAYRTMLNGKKEPVPAPTGD